MMEHGWRNSHEAKGRTAGKATFISHMASIVSAPLSVSDGKGGSRGRIQWIVILMMAV